MFPSLPSSGVPVRLSVTAVIPIGSTAPATIVVTCDPPSDRYEVVWYQDTVTEVLTPSEALCAIDTLVHEALKVIEVGTWAERRDAFPEDRPRGVDLRSEMDGQLTIV